jgi:hypothetical protein
LNKAPRFAKSCPRLNARGAAARSRGTIPLFGEEPAEFAVNEEFVDALDAAWDISAARTKQGSDTWNNVSPPACDVSPCRARRNVTKG